MTRAARHWQLALCGLLALLPLLVSGNAPEMSFIATLKTSADTRFADILGAGVQSRFSASVTPGVAVALQPGETIWLRLRAQMPERADGDWVIRSPRTPIARVQLFLPDRPDAAVASAGFFDLPESGRSDHTGLRVALPAGPAGPAEYYLRLGGDVRTTLVPQLMTRAAADAADAESLRLIRWCVIGFAIVTLLGIIRFVLKPHCGSGSVAFAAAMLIPAVLAGSGVLYALPVGQGFASKGTMGLWMLLLLPCGPLLLATARYSGAPFALPKLMARIRMISLVLPFVAIAMLVLRTDLATDLQILVWLLWAALAVSCLGMLLADSRRYRWGPIIAWTLVIFALWLRVSVELQWLEANRLTMLGSLPALLLLTTLMLALPWLRAVQQRVAARRQPAPATGSATPAAPHGAVPVAAQTRAHSPLQPVGSSVAGAAGDAEWAAFRQLLNELARQLPQQSAAVVAHYRGTDLLLAEPADAEDRYRSMLERSSSLLQGLSRARGPQQLAIDFDGPDGPLPIAQLAAVPLPIDPPGWGVLLIERPEQVTYSAEQLARCSEQAALATRRSEAPAARRRQQQAAELDPGTGVYRSHLVEDMVQQQIAQAQLRGRPLAVLRVEFEGVAAGLQSMPEATGDALARIGTALREQLEFGETVVRLSDSGFLLILPGHHADACHPLAHRILGAVQRLGLPPELQPRIGISELRRGESRAAALIERSAAAAETARRSGTPTVA